MKNLTLCLIMHLFNRSTLLCKCPFNREIGESEPHSMNLTVNYITQNGRANIAGNGTIEYKTLRDNTHKLEMLEAENRILVDMLLSVRNRDK